MCADRPSRFFLINLSLEWIHANNSTGSPPHRLIDPGQGASIRYDMYAWLSSKLEKRSRRRIFYVLFHSPRDLFLWSSAGISFRAYHGLWLLVSRSLPLHLYTPWDVWLMFELVRWRCKATNFFTPIVIYSDPTEVKLFHPGLKTVCVYSKSYFGRLFLFLYSRVFFIAVVLVFNFVIICSNFLS